MKSTDKKQLLDFVSGLVQNYESITDRNKIEMDKEGSVYERERASQEFSKSVTQFETAIIIKSKISEFINSL